MWRTRCSKGVTLIELMISVVLISVLAGAIWMVYDVAMRTFYAQGKRTTVKADAGSAFIKISEELRQAVSVTTATATGVTITVDTDDDGVNETIQYTWAGAAGNPLQRIYSTETRSLASSVASLALTYYDSSNTLLSFPVTVSQVKAVVINMTITDGDESLTLRSRADLRNL